MTEQVFQNDIIGDYALSPVPEEARKSSFNAMLVAAGWSICMSALFVGGTLGLNLSFREGIIAVIIGQAILYVVGSITVYLGAKYGVSTALLTRECFGEIGAALFGLILVITLGIGWFAWQSAFFGMTINSMFGELGFWLTNPKIATIWGALLMMLTAYYGYKGVAYLSYLAVPLIMILCIFGVTLAIETTGSFAELFTVQPIEKGMSILEGAIIVVGASVAGAICLPDVSRYVKGDPKKGTIITITGYVLGGAFCMICALAMTLTAHVPGVGTVADIPAVMNALGLGFGALLVLIAAQWSTNDNNLYTGALGLVNIVRIKRRHGVILLGIIGLTIAAMGIQDYFVPFLNVLGIFIPPIAGVLAADHWIVRGKRPYDFGPGAEHCKLNVLALIVTVISGYIGGYVIKSGLSSIYSILIATLLYAILSRIFDMLNITYVIK